VAQAKPKTKKPRGVEEFTVVRAAAALRLAGVPSFTAHGGRY